MPNQNKTKHCTETVYRSGPPFDSLAMAIISLQVDSETEIVDKGVSWVIVCSLTALKATKYKSAKKTQLSAASLDIEVTFLKYACHTTSSIFKKHRTEHAYQRASPLDQWCQLRAQLTQLPTEPSSKRLLLDGADSFRAYRREANATKSQTLTERLCTTNWPNVFVHYRNFCSNWVWRI